MVDHIPVGAAQTMTVTRQLQLYEVRRDDAPCAPQGDARQRLSAILSSDLDFHDRASDYASHNMHAFPAKFPPQVPRVFIQALTQQGDIVLDPMMGSGTTLVEALLAGRCPVGADIDPLALLIGRVKTTPIDPQRAARAGLEVLQRARSNLGVALTGRHEDLLARMDEETRAFVDYWFDAEAQRELAALAQAIGAQNDTELRAFLKLVLSACIVTKSGGVSRARDLAHTRPHRVQAKPVRSALVEFEKRLRKNLHSLRALEHEANSALAICADTQNLPLADGTVDLVVTSPPYASNAIDYMRASKFSLVWQGYSIRDLGARRKRYVGGEALTDIVFEELPSLAAERVAAVAETDAKKGAVLHRYYSEMARALREMLRVLKPGRAAIVVVGTSLMRSVDTQTQMCLGEIGAAVGFELVGIGTRRLDRDRRMMPARAGGVRTTQIEQRMHEEYVIGFVK